MAAGEERRDDFYKVMGLKKECSSEEIRNAYKKLAMRWHPDRCSATRNEEAKTKFQAIQEAYSVLSNTNKRFLYDVGIREDDDDHEYGMGDFLGEMAAMMRKSKPSKNKEESFEELQDLFNEMFQVDMCGSFGDPFIPPSSSSSSSSCFTDSFVFCNGDGGAAGYSLKRDIADMNSGRRTTTNFSTASSAGVEVPHQFSSGDQSFCFGVSGSGGPLTRSVHGGRGNGGGRRRSGRKQKVSSRHDVSSQDAGISFSGISA